MTQQNSKGITFGLLFFTALMLAAALPVRIYQQFRLIEANGFWRRAEATQILLYIFIAMLIIIPACVAFFTRGKAAIDLTRRRRIPEGIAALFAACAMAMDAMSAGLLASNMLQTLALGTGRDDQSQMIFRSGAAAAAVEAIFAAFSVLLFISLVLINFLPNKKIFLNRLLLLTPVVWAASGMLRRFARTINYLRVSDLFLAIIALVALTLFFLYFAQLVGGISDEGRAARLFAAGIPAAVLSLLCFVPRAAASLSGIALSQDATLDVWALALPVFILITIAGRLYSAHAHAPSAQQSIPADEIAEEIADEAEPAEALMEEAGNTAEEPEEA